MRRRRGRDEQHAVERECFPRFFGAAQMRDALRDLVATPVVYKKIVGMQMLVEGLAMGAFATFFNNINDPLGKKLMQLVMTDEAFHHKFGKIWADRTIPYLAQSEHDMIEDWAAQVFQILLYNLGRYHEAIALYRTHGDATARDWHIRACAGVCASAPFRCWCGTSPWTPSTRRSFCCARGTPTTS